MANVEIVRNPQASRFELLLNGERIGGIEYVQRGSHVAMTHAEVSEEFSGQGLAGTLVEAALADVRARGEQVVAQCPYVRDYIGKHPEWADLVANGESPT